MSWFDVTCKARIASPGASAPGVTLREGAFGPLFFMSVMPITGVAGLLLVGLLALCWLTGFVFFCLYVVEVKQMFALKATMFSWGKTVLKEPWDELVSY